MPKFTGRAWQVLTVAFLPVLFAGCGQGDKEISFSSGGMTHTFAQGKDAFPKDFPLPLYPDATTTGSVSAEGSTSKEHSKFLMLSSTDSVEKVSNFYSEQFKSNGWTLADQQTSGNLRNISASKADMEANVMVSGDGGKTTISLAISEGPKDHADEPDDSSNFEPNKLTPPTD